MSGDKEASSPAEIFKKLQGNKPTPSSPSKQISSDPAPQILPTQKDIKYVPPSKTPSKIFVMGESGVGKTELIGRLKGKPPRQSHGTFPIPKPSNLDDKILEYKDKEGKLHRGKTPATEIIFVIVFDITNIDSFKNTPIWLDKVRRDEWKAVPTLLIGNKSDAAPKRKVSSEEAESFAKHNGLFYLETSAETCDEILALYDHTLNIEKLIESRPSVQPPTPF